MLSGRRRAKVGQMLIGKGRWKVKVRGQRSADLEAGAEGTPRGGSAKAKPRVNLKGEEA